MLNYDRIKETFVYADDCPVEVACLLSMIRFYNGDQSPRQLLEWADTGESMITLDGMKQAAIRAGFTANIRLMTLEELREKQLPCIIFMRNELGELLFAVCYGFRDKRFVVGEPNFALMQYFPAEMNALWIDGIALDLFPGLEFERINPSRHK